MKSAIQYLPKPKPLWFHDLESKFKNYRLRIHLLRARLALLLLRAANRIHRPLGDGRSLRAITLNELLESTRLNPNSKVTIVIGNHRITIEHHPDFLQANLQPQNILHN